MLYKGDIYLFVKYIFGEVFISNKTQPLKKGLTLHHKLGIGRIFDKDYKKIRGDKKLF